MILRRLPVVCPFVRPGGPLVAAPIATADSMVTATATAGHFVALLDVDANEICLVPGARRRLGRPGQSGCPPLLCSSVRRCRSSLSAEICTVQSKGSLLVGGSRWCFAWPLYLRVSVVSNLV